MQWRFATIGEAAPYQSECPGLTWINPATILYNGFVLRRIVALENNALGYASSGDIGGFVQSGSNLSQFHEAWVDQCAKVYGDAIVSEQALVNGDAEVFGNARVFGNTHLTGGARVGRCNNVGRYYNRNFSYSDSDWFC